MAAIYSAVPTVPTSQTPAIEPSKAAFSIKSLAESAALSSGRIPSTYVFSADEADRPDDVVSDTLPVIDFSLLTSGDPDQRSTAVQEVGRACQEWGFFMVINHGVPEKVTASMVGACQAFFNLTEEEKRAYEAKHSLSPIKCGTSFNRCRENIFCWRDFLNLLVHPTFHCPDKPRGFREPVAEYCRATRELGLQLVRGISESLGLEPDYIEKVSDQAAGWQLLTANLYPRCPQPELAMGIAPHTDDGYINLLIQNGVGGLQLQHKGSWVNVEAAPNSFLVLVSDQLEVLSNGKYKSVIHRVGVNNSASRISIAVSLAPAVDDVVAPAPELVDENNPPAYHPMKYGDYLKEVHSDSVPGSVLGIVRVNPSA